VTQASVNKRFAVTTRLRRHVRLMTDMGRMAVWFARRGRISIYDGSGVVGEFESAFRDLTHSRFALATNSGTAALHSAYFAVGVGPGTEVIVPSYTWHASATTVLQCGAVPVFCDIDPHTLTMSVEDMARKITDRTRAVCPVHIWGNPAEMDRIVELAHSRGVAVVEDCSHAHGAAYDGRPVGSWGDVGCFSLHASKPVAGGEAGVAVTDDPVLFDRMVLLGHVGRARSGAATRALGVGDADLGLTDLGVKYRPHPLAIHLARSSLKRLSRENARRRKLWARIEEELHGSTCLQTPHTLAKAERGGYYSFVVEHIAHRGGPDAVEVVEAARSRGIPVDLDPYAKRLLHKSPTFTTLDRAMLGGGCFDATRSREENRSAVALPVCELVSSRLLAFDRMIYMAGERFVARCARELRRIAEEHLDAVPIGLNEETA
jgi:perosamine synthetase